MYEISEINLIAKYNHFSTIWASKEANSPLEKEAKGIIVTNFQRKTSRS